MAQCSHGMNCCGTPPPQHGRFCIYATPTTPTQNHWPVTTSACSLRDALAAETHQNLTVETPCLKHCSVHWNTGTLCDPCQLVCAPEHLICCRFPSWRTTAAPHGPCQLGRAPERQNCLRQILPSVCVSCRLACAPQHRNPLQNLDASRPTLRQWPH
jgi:hypothetical protein